MQFHPQQNPQQFDFSIRPAYRVLGALFLAFIAFLMVMQGMLLLDVGELMPAQCSGKGQFFCVLGNYLLAAIPPRNQGAMAALGGFAFAALLAVLAAALLKPLFFKPRR